MKELTRLEVQDLLFNYGASGTKVFDAYAEITEGQKQDIVEGWSDYFNGNLDEVETEELIDRITRYFNNDRFFIINYDEKSLDGYSTGNGGMICYDEKTITNTLENALGFEIRKDAEEYVAKHKDEWVYGTLTIMD